MLNISAQTNWTIVSPSSAPILSHTPYNLRSTKDNSILAYLNRRYGIKLSWGKEGARPAIFQFVKQGGGPIKCGDRIGLMNDDGGYIFYNKRPAGINLSFSDTQSYEWEIRTVNNVKGEPILPGQPIGLLS